MIRSLVAALLALASPALADTSASGSHIYNMSCTVYFSPNGGAQNVLISAIDGARSNIRVAAYELTVQAIADALIAAKKRSVDVRVIVDETESKQSYSKAGYLAANGVPVSYDPTVAIFHNKFMTIDGFELFTGSYNYSQSAESRNAENMLACHTTGGAAAYNLYWADVFPRTVAIAP